MIFFMIFYGLSTLTRTYSDTITSPKIRNVATKAFETRLIPHEVENRNPLHSYVQQQQNRYDQSTGSLKSYVIYGNHPLKIFKEWKGSLPTGFPASAPQNYLEFYQQPNTEFTPDFYGKHALTPPKPTLAYRSVYSNVIKVFDNSLGNLDRNRFESDGYVKPYGVSVWKSRPSIDYEPVQPQDIITPQPYSNLKLPENFPNVFSPNSKFHFSSFDERVLQPSQYLHPRHGFYNTHTINYNTESEGNADDAEILPEETFNQNNNRKPFLCSFIRVNQKQFPENGIPCGRSEDDLPIALPDYPDYSNLPNHQIPLEHRRQHIYIKRIKRSESNDSFESRQKREVGFGYGYSGWGSPFTHDNGYDGYFTDTYPSRAVYRGFNNNYDSSSYNNNRNRNQGYRNRYYSGGRNDDFDDYQNNDYSNTRGLTGYLTNGGRRYQNRKNSDQEDENDDENTDNNRDNDSDEEMQRMNSNRREADDRRNNEDSRDRRRNNNNNNNNNSNGNNSNNNSNDEDDYRENRRNNRNNNSRRYNSNNNNNNNRRYNNNDRYDYNNDRNRYYGNGNGYSSYGSNYGAYGNGGYGSSYGNSGGYGFGGGYGNGFGSF